MSANKLINAVIALVEDRPQVAREMLRSPEVTVSIGEVQARLFDAIRKREASAKLEALKGVLRASLRIESNTKPRGKSVWSDAQQDAYLLGIGAVETIIDDAIDSLGVETQILSGVHTPLPVPGDDA